MVNHEKDVDGLTAYNLGLLFEGTPKLIPCTPLDILELLDFYNIDVRGMDVAIINRSINYSYFYMAISNATECQGIVHYYDTHNWKLVTEIDGKVILVFEDPYLKGK